MILIKNIYKRKKIQNVDLLTAKESSAGYRGNKKFSFQMIYVISRNNDLLFIDITLYYIKTSLKLKKSCE
ncbi:hypothetical protein CYANOKiyG1_05140 [Okeania sp. KiyG1]|nr:hypothetical protein CYANOKiyG1_05140 [Okeania sp. KiyG1]